MEIVALVAAFQQGVSVLVLQNTQDFWIEQINVLSSWPL